MQRLAAGPFDCLFGDISQANNGVSDNIFASQAGATGEAHAGCVRSQKMG
jgi:hypothetical protein